MTRFFLFTSLLAVPAVALSVASRIETGKAATPLRVSRVCALLAFVFLAVAAIAAVTGPHRIDLIALLRQGIAPETSPEHTIVFSVRIPRILLAAVVGATLSTEYLTGLGTVDERMLILVDIEKMMTSDEMALVEKVAS